MARRTRYTKRMVSQRIGAVQPPPETPIDEPMHRYTHTIPATLPHAIPTSTIQMGYIEESLARQNQMLLDILTAIDALTTTLAEKGDDDT